MAVYVPVFLVSSSTLSVHVSVWVYTCMRVVCTSLLPSDLSILTMIILLIVCACLLSVCTLLSTNTCVHASVYSIPYDLLHIAHVCVCVHTCVWVRGVV